MQEKEKSAGKGQKKSWFQGLKSEFGKIIWTDRNTLIKQTVVVVFVTISPWRDYQRHGSATLEGINLLMK